MWQVYYSNIDNLNNQLADDKWATCERSMALYSMPTFELVGRVKSGCNGACWIWSAEGCRMLDLDENGNHKEERCATRHAGGTLVEDHPAGMEDIGVDEN